MFTNQSILETNADPYPSLISVIGQVPYLEPGQLFFYLFAIIIFTFLLGLMNAANTAFNNISESNIFQLKKSEETQDKKILALLDKPATLKAAIVIAQTLLLVAIVAIAVTLLDRIVFFPQYLFLGILLKLIFIAIYLLLTVMYVPNVYAQKHHFLFVRKITGLIRFVQWLLKPLVLLILLLTKLLIISSGSLATKSTRLMVIKAINSCNCGDNFDIFCVCFRFLEIIRLVVSGIWVQ